MNLTGPPKIVEKSWLEASIDSFVDVAKAILEGGDTQQQGCVKVEVNNSPGAKVEVKTGDNNCAQAS